MINKIIVLVLLSLALQSLVYGQESIPRSKRVQILEMSGLDQDTQKWDELDKDLLVGRAKSGVSVFELKQKYPDLSLQKLEALVEATTKPHDTIPSILGITKEERVFEDDAFTPLTFDPSKPTLLFLDLNVGAFEITAARAAAEARGENFLIYPERTDAQQNQIIRQALALDKIASRLKDCVKASGDCSALELQYRNAHKDLESLTGQLVRLDGKGLKNIFSDLNTKGVRLSSLVLSGHSGGSSGFSGVSGILSINDIKEAWDSQPSVTSDIKSVLLWGCYTGTLNSLHNTWQKVFPNVKILVGYQTRAPLGIREESGMFLKSFLINENKILGAPTIQDAHSVFKSLDLVADLDGMAHFGEYYLSYEKVQLISEMLKRCDSFPEPLLQTFLCYLKGEPGCENPPPDHVGPLRNLYSFLQVNGHCRDILNEKYKNLPTTDYLIRFIYIDNVKQNLAVHRQKDLAPWASLLEKSEFSGEFGLENFFRGTHSENMKLIDKLYGQFVLKGERDGSLATHPQLKSVFRLIQAKFQLPRLLLIPYFSEDRYFFPAEECIPFSWVDLNSREKDLCSFESIFLDPLPPYQEVFFVTTKTFIGLAAKTFATDPGLGYYFYNVPNSLGGLRDAYVKAVTSSLKGLSMGNYDSPKGPEIRAFAESIIKKAEGWTDRQTAEVLLSEIPIIINYIDQQLPILQQTPFSDDALRQFTELRKRLTSLTELLKRFLQ